MITMVQLYPPLLSALVRHLNRKSHYFSFFSMGKKNGIVVLYFSEEALVAKQAKIKGQQAL